jgi:hypothetical protein
LDYKSKFLNTEKGLNKSYNVVLADFVEVVNEKQADLSMLPVSKICKKVFVQLIKQTTGKQLEGSSQRTERGVIVTAYNGIKEVIKPNMNMIIGGVVYGNLEVSDIVGSKIHIQIQAWA